MSWSFKMLEDETVPEDSPLFGADVSIEREAIYDLPDHGPLYTWVDDPEWEFTDSNGHEHFRNDSGDFPTLTKVETDCGGCGACSDLDEPYTWVEWQCVGCFERVPHPGKKRELYRPEVPSHLTVTITRKVLAGRDMTLLGDIEPYTWESCYGLRTVTHILDEPQWIRVVEAHNAAVNGYLETQ